jgi:hypothetical protein
MTRPASDPAGTPSHARKHIMCTDLIVIDDIAMLPSARRRRGVYQPVDAPHENRSLIVTSNKPFGKAHGFAGTYVMALSFLYLTTRRFLRVLLGSLRSEHAKDIEIAVLRHQHRQPGRRPARPNQGGHPSTRVNRRIPRQREPRGLAVTPLDGT